MYIYYKGKNKKNEIIEGQLEANSNKEAISILKEKYGLVAVLRLKELDNEVYSSNVKNNKGFKSLAVIKTKSGKIITVLDVINKINGKKVSNTDNKNIGNIEKKSDKKNKIKIKVPIREIRLFTKKLSILLSSGVSLSQGLNTLKNVKNKNMKSILNDVQDTVQQGNSLSYALSQFPKQFDKLYISMVAIGEESGSLDKCLIDIIQFQDKQLKIKKKLRSAMIYPSIVLGVVFLILILGSIFFIPMFSKLFKDLEVPLPAITKMVFFIADKFYIIALTPFLLFILIQIIKKSSDKLNKKYIIFKNKLLLKIPVISNFILTSSMFYFSHTLAVMLKNGMKMLDSLKLAKDIIKNSIINSEIDNAIVKLLNGISLSEALVEQEHFESLICDIISTGEESGHIYQSLLEVSNYYEEQLEYHSTLLMETIQPVSILFVAAIIIPILFAIFIPILDISSGQFVQ